MNESALRECRDALGSINVQAFLRVIRAGETDQEPHAYRMIVGGGLFESFDDHPRTVVWLPKLKLNSSAAGAYQFLAGTWNECRDALSLADFSPPMQDLAAIFLIRRRGALADVLAGEVMRAIAKCSREWASLPGSPYGQPVRTMAQALQTYREWGGKLASEASAPATAPEQPPTPEASPPATSIPPAPTWGPLPGGEAGDPQPETPMGPFLIPAILELAKSIPKLGAMFANSDVAQRNVKAAEVVLDAVLPAVGAANAQDAVERVKADPAAAAAAAKAVEMVWWDITEAGGGGIDGARKNDATYSAPDGPRFWHSPVFWITVFMLPLVYIALYAVLFREGFSNDIKAMVLGAIFGGLLTGGIQSYFYGTSASSQRKTELMGK